MSIEKSDVVTQNLRQSGFKVLAIFSLTITLAIVVATPANIYIAALFPSLWLTLSLIALLRPEYDERVAKLWALLSTPAAPTLVILNGILPATLVSLATIFPVMLLRGPWRVISLLSLACCTFLVPLSDIPYDFDIWVRLCITNVTVAIMVYILVTYLEKSLIEISENSRVIQHALEAEKSAKQSQERFLATMSHEIRTPMNGVLGLIDTVLSKEINESQRPKLELIKRSGHILNTILNDILDFSKLAANKLVFEQIPIDLKLIAEDVRQTFIAKADENNTQLIIAVNSNLAKAYTGDPARISQVLNNLVSNAVKYTTAGQITLSIGVQENIGNSHRLRFEVSDTGRGIPSSQLESIFQPFEQANESDARLYGGTGLGLQIAKSLVEAMSGKIYVKSKPGSGSQFYFDITLPLFEKAETSISSDIGNDYQFSGRILVVDDNEINRIVASEMLSTLGVSVVLAEDGHAAVSLCRTEKFDLILMDLNMPGLDGCKATQEIRRTDNTTPVIALTAAVLPDEVTKALQAGMNYHLAKPINKSKLVGLLDIYLC